jgi:hypothetical protein
MGITVSGDKHFEINIPQYAYFTRTSEDEVRQVLRASSGRIITMSENKPPCDVMPCQLSHGRFSGLRDYYTAESPREYQCHVNKYDVSFKALLIMCGDPKHFA